MASDDIGAQVSHIHNLEYRYPNSCFNRLQYPVWSKLLSRIGDVVMTYLLENTSMFLLVPTSCYVQLTGVPFFELWPMQPGKYISIPQKTTMTTHTKSFKRKKKCNQTNSSKKPRYNENQTNINIETMATTNSQDQANSCSQGNVSRKPEATHSEDLTFNSTVKATTINCQANINSCSQGNVSSKPEATQGQNPTNNSTVNATNANSEDLGHFNSCSQANVSKKPEATHSEDLTINSTVNATTAISQDWGNFNSYSQANVSRKPVNKEDQANIIMDAQAYHKKCFIKATGESPSIEGLTIVQVHNDKKTMEKSNNEDPLNTTSKVNEALNSCTKHNVYEETIANIDGELPRRNNNSNPPEYNNNENYTNTGSDIQSSVNEETRPKTNHDTQTDVNNGTNLSSQITAELNTEDNQIARKKVSWQPKKYPLDIQEDDNLRLTNTLNAAFNITARREISFEKGTVCDNGNSNMQLRSREITAEKICDNIPNQTSTVIVPGKFQNTRQMKNKVSRNNKKKRRKRKKLKYQEFSPYEYHTYINRIQTLYASNLREKFTDNYILNSIPPTEDGCLTLYRHILEHKQTIKAPKVTIAWRFPEHSVNSIGNESSCCASSTHNITELVADANNDIDDHSSFFRNTYSYDKVITKFIEKETTENSKSSSQNDPDITVAEICDAYQQKKSQNPIADAEIKNSVSGNLISINLQKSNSIELNVIRTNSDYQLTTILLIVAIEEKVLNGLRQTRSFQNMKTPKALKRVFEDSQGFETSGNEDSLTISQKCKESFDGISSFDSKSDIQVIEGIKSLSQSFDSKTFSTESEKSVSILSKVKSEGHGCFTNIKSKKSELCLDKDNIDKQFSSTPLEDNENQSSKPNLSKIDYDDNCPLKSMECKRSMKRKHVDDLEICCPADKRPRISLEVSSVPESKESPNKACVEMEVEESVAEVNEKTNDGSNEIRLPTTEEEAKEEGQASKNKIELCKSTVCGDKITSSTGENCDIHSQRCEEIKDAQLNTIEVDFLPTVCPLFQQILVKHRTDLQKLISSNKYDKLCIGQMMSGIKVSTISWLRTVKSNSVRQHIMAKVWHWIIEEFVLNVIKKKYDRTVNLLFTYRCLINNCTTAPGKASTRRFTKCPK
ncbi:EST2 [Mytilus edulis]|uniref:Telomerase reverse transcriptase n=1 Tax=Mytilus edulis TaxID=6550 RepID=A0A8S3UZK2_MYTED|nr:EST2 [Mytilus edulis]